MNLTPEQAQEIKAAIEEAPFLYSARHNRDYETMAVFCHEKWPEFALSEVDVHQIMRG